MCTIISIPTNNDKIYKCIDVNVSNKNGLLRVNKRISYVYYVTSYGKTYTNVLTLKGLKRQLAVSHRQSAVSNPLVNVRRFHQTVRRFCQTVRRIHQTIRRIQQTVSSMEKALLVTL